MVKIMTMADAVSQFVHDGDMMAMGGCTNNRKPYALVREMIRQKKKELYIFGLANGGDADMLIGAGCCRAYVNSYTANSGFSNVNRMYRRAVEQDKLLLEDYSLDVQALIIHAASLGLPFVAVKHMLGSDLADKARISHEVRAQHPKLPPEKLIIGENPFEPGEKYCFIPVPKIDLGIIHVQKASPDGTARIEGPVFADVDIAIAAHRLIITCEELITNEEIRREPDRNQIANILPDAIVVAPYGAHPSQVYNYYDYDRDYYRYYDEVGKSDETYAQYLEEWVYGPADHEAYLEKLGMKRVLSLNVTKGAGYCVQEMSWGGAGK